MLKQAPGSFSVQFWRLETSFFKVKAYLISCFLEQSSLRKTLTQSSAICCCWFIFWQNWSCPFPLCSKLASHTCHGKSTGFAETPAPTLESIEY